MAKLIAYGMLSTQKNAIAGSLVKAQCEFCGAKYGSFGEARKCESKHIQDAIQRRSVHGTD